MNRRLRDGGLEADLGSATWLSYARGTVALWLLTATIAGLDLPGPGLAPGAVVVGALTDGLDGVLARRGRRATKLGAYADGGADLVLALALTLAAGRRGTLPVGACGLPAARYALPVSVAFGTAFAGGRSPALEHTLLGRLCGAAQTALMGYALAPKRKHGFDKPRRLLLALTAALSVASGAAQAARVVYPGMGGHGRASPRLWRRLKDRPAAPCSWVRSGTACYSDRREVGMSYPVGAGASMIGRRQATIAAGGTGVDPLS
jgi:phosphatidylglycerophosphate synthase